MGVTRVDGNYREFHSRRDPVSGFSYWEGDKSIGGSSPQRKYIILMAALGRAKEHANHFVDLVERLLLEFNGETGKQRR